MIGLTARRALWRLSAPLLCLAAGIFASTAVALFAGHPTAWWPTVGAFAIAFAAIVLLQPFMAKALPAIHWCIPDTFEVRTLTPKSLLLHSIREALDNARVGRVPFDTILVSPADHARIGTPETMTVVFGTHTEVFPLQPHGWIPDGTIALILDGVGGHAVVYRHEVKA